MITPMPSPRGTNHAGLFLSQRAEPFNVADPSPPMVAFDSNDGLLQTKGATDMRSAVARDDIPRRAIPDGPDQTDTELWHKMLDFLKQNLSPQNFKTFLAMVKEHPPQEGATKKDKDDDNEEKPDKDGMKAGRLAADSRIAGARAERFPRAHNHMPRQL